MTASDWINRSKADIAWLSADQSACRIYSSFHAFAVVVVVLSSCSGFPSRTQLDARRMNGRIADGPADCRQQVATLKK